MKLEINPRELELLLKAMDCLTIELKRGAQWKLDDGELIDTIELDKLYYKIERIE